MTSLSVPEDWKLQILADAAVSFLNEMEKEKRTKEVSGENDSSEPARKKIRTLLPDIRPRPQPRPEPERESESHNLNDNADKTHETGPSTFTCPARNCDAVFISVVGRRVHAHEHEKDDDQEHLAAYLYCPIAGCNYTRPLFDDEKKRRLSSKDCINDHLRKGEHRILSKEQAKEVRDVCFTRCKMARRNLGLSAIRAAKTPLPTWGTAMLPPPLALKGAPIP